MSKSFYSETSSSTASLDYDMPIRYEKETELKSQRKASISSRRTSLSISHDYGNLEDIRRYSEPAIRGSLDDIDLEIKRQATRTTILELIAKAEPVCGENYVVDGVRIPVDDDGEEFAQIDPELITWGYNNSEDPRNWKLSKKAKVIALVSLYTVVSPISASILSPAVEDLANEFDVTSSTVKALVTSIHILAWAIGPLVIAPLSENYKIGRRPVLLVSCWLTFCFNLSCGFSSTIVQILALRFVSGLFSAIPLNVSPAVVSDMFDARSRNVSLAGVFLIPFLGAAIAPIMGGLIVTGNGWRWVVYTLAIINGSIATIGTLLYPETYSPKLLHDKAKAVRKATGNPNLHTIYELTADGFKFSELRITVLRPIVMLFTDPLVIGLGSFMAIIYGFLYMMIVTFPSVFKTTYGFSQSTASLMYLSLGIGFTLGVLFWTVAIGLVYEHLSRKHGIAKPEFRLPCLFITSGIIPIGLLWYGWSAQLRLHWIMPCIGSAIFAFGLVCVFQVLQAYLIDANPRYGASSIAASSIFRCLFGFAFPLFATQLYDNLGYGWGYVLWAILAVVLGVPFPIICYKYGERIREWTTRNEISAASAKAEATTSKVVSK